MCLKLFFGPDGTALEPQLHGLGLNLRWVRAVTATRAAAVAAPQMVGRSENVQAVFQIVVLLHLEFRSSHCCFPMLNPLSVALGATPTQGWPW